MGRQSTTIDPLAAASTADPLSGQTATRDAARNNVAVGLLPLICLAASLGVLLVSLAGRASRTGLFEGQAVFWTGITLIVAPVLVRHLTRSASRGEHVGLVLLLGIALYLVKVVGSAQAFTFPDELAHTYNVTAMLETGRLFHPNPLVVVTPLYPGLGSVVAALSSLTGLSIFQAGIAVAALARLMIMLVIFLLVEQLSGESRLGGLAATLYAGHPNFLFYSAEFSYETLALPLAGLVLLAAIRRGAGEAGGERVAWTIIGLLAIVATTVTHHVTSYALAGTLCLATLIGLLRRRRDPYARTPWDLAAASVLAVLVWFGTVGSATANYLGFVFGPAAQQTLAALLTGQPGRQLFQSSSLGASTPLWQQLLGYLSVLVVAAGLIYGLTRVRRRSLLWPVSPVLILAAAAYIPMQGLRLTQAGWETANRSSEFLFLGCALVLAIAATDVLRRSPLANTAGTTLVAAAGVVIVLGGALAGWPYSLQLPPPYLVRADNGRVVEPEGVTTARWALARLGPDNVIATDPSNALMLAAYGQQIPFSGQARGIQRMLLAPYFDASSSTVLRGIGADYVVLDRRVRSLDHGSGFYPPGGSGPLSAPSPIFDAAVVAKLDTLPGVQRIADSGNVVVYDVRALDDATVR